MRLATFNVQNLRLREDASGPHFDGARDEIKPLAKLSTEERRLDAQDRALTAKLIAAANADVLALQEVFDQATLDAFHASHLAPLGAHYPHRICLPGNDGRRHVALMSRHPLENVQSHAALTYADIGLAPPDGSAAADRVFRRDCLTASCNGLLLMNVHFKAPASESDLAVLRVEALAVRMLIERRFADPSAAAWAVLGDVNVSDVPSGDVLAVLTQNFAQDVGASLPADARWTYFHAGHSSYARPDRILLSPALASRCRGLKIRREGLSRAARAYPGPRFDHVGELRPRASDHALLIAELIAANGW